MKNTKQKTEPEIDVYVLSNYALYAMNRNLGISHQIAVELGLGNNKYKKRYEEIRHI